MLEEVKRNGINLCFIKEQTPEICLAAVNQNGGALIFVKEQTPEICLAAVSDRGDSLEYAQGGMLNKDEHYIFKKNNIRKVYVNKIDNKWLLTVGYQNNITKDEFIDRIYNTDGGLKENPHRHEYLNFLEKF